MNGIQNSGKNNNNSTKKLINVHMPNCWYAFVLPVQWQLPHVIFTGRAPRSCRRMPGWQSNAPPVLFIVIVGAVGGDGLTAALLLVAVFDDCTLDCCCWGWWITAASRPSSYSVLFTILAVAIGVDVDADVMGMAVTTGIIPSSSSNGGADGGGPI